MKETRTLLVTSLLDPTAARKASSLESGVRRGPSSAVESRAGKGAPPVSGDRHRTARCLRVVCRATQNPLHWDGHLTGDQYVSHDS